MHTACMLLGAVFAMKFLLLLLTLHCKTRGKVRFKTESLIERIQLELKLMRGLRLLAVSVLCTS